MQTKTYDVAIVGGGAAGLSAALVLGRARRDVVVIDAGEPRNAPAAHMQGYLSRDGMPPSELLKSGRVEVASYGVRLVEDRVLDAAAGFELQTESTGTVAARHVLLAGGATDVLPDIPGVRERWGRDFLHCPYCHGYEVADQPIGVLATGPGSIQQAHLLRQWSDDVTYFTNTHALADDERATLAARGVAVVDGAVQRLVIADDRLQAVQLDDGRTVRRAAVFMRPRLRARPDSVAAALGCALSSDGLVLADADGRTSVLGVWAAGNAANPRAQVITAAGDASAAAIAINNQIVADEVAATAGLVGAA
ncbi:NAD(P)/FAD-dependent oxidoreductase [Baekduia soli]|uniref:NAD(P)/FAD-dependent oxidoreductase n=1 Tax=Baekduia soli TaxID=496014 RepID=A0A5B8TZN1_9ACTN|nr:NAD(P)/FAD-dependent oxidoreductase [Baekduia soli]QEC46186.1 NAD(P)/FAD-dependent oxidoreductase [Baekduia soli]